MNFIAPGAEPRIREIPLSRLALAPENVRRTPPDAAADAELRASIAAHGLLENLVVRPDATDEDPGSGPISANLFCIWSVFFVFCSGFGLWRAGDGGGLAGFAVAFAVGLA